MSPPVFEVRTDNTRIRIHVSMELLDIRDIDYGSVAALQYHHVPLVFDRQWRTHALLVVESVRLQLIVVGAVDRDEYDCGSYSPHSGEDDDMIVVNQPSDQSSVVVVANR